MNLSITRPEAHLLGKILSEYTSDMAEEAEDLEDEAQYSTGAEAAKYRAEAKKFRDMVEIGLDLKAKLRKALR